MTATRATTASMLGRPDSSQAYSSWSARARDLVSGRCTEPLKRIGGLERRLHRLGALAQARQRLRFVVGGQDAEAYRDAVRERDVAQAARRFARDILEMRRLAPDHASERHDRVETLARRRGLGQHRQLERAGRPGDLDVGIRDPALAQRLARAVEQLRGDVLVKATDDDRYAPLPVRRSRSGSGC